LGNELNGLGDSLSFSGYLDVLQRYRPSA